MPSYINQDNAVRVTRDYPLINPHIIDNVIQEHVTKYIHDNKSKFKTYNVKFGGDVQTLCGHSRIIKEDLVVIKRLIQNTIKLTLLIYMIFYSNMKKEELRENLMRNIDIKKNKGLLKSLLIDELYRK